MAFIDEWKALSARIRALMQIAQLNAQIQGSDSLGRAKRFRDQAENIFLAVREFRHTFAESLGPVARAAIDSFIERAGPIILDTSGGPLAQERSWTALILLGVFESELTYLLTDVQELIRTRSERAFAHLQRSIAADAEVRSRWLGAFEIGEVACEKLGAAHMLLHGIYAFKVNAAGGRTDLIFQEPIVSLTQEERYADGIVVTEWKKSSTGGDVGDKFAQARSQLKAYTEGVLGGCELAAYRYAIVISPTQIAVPEDVIDGVVTYRHINIAVNPITPSRQH